MDGADGSERARWMEAAQAGDREAYRALLVDVQDELARFVRRRVKDPDEAQDIVQDTLLVIHRARHTYDPSRPFEPWMYAIARNVTIDHLRRRASRGRHEVVTDDLPDAPAPSETSETPLAAALEKMPPSQREAFSMLKLEGLSVEAAAARAGVAPGTLRVRAHRAYRTIKATLGRDGSGGKDDA